MDELLVGIVRDRGVGWWLYPLSKPVGHEGSFAVKGVVPTRPPPRTNIRNRVEEFLQIVR